VKLTFYKKTK